MAAVPLRKDGGMIWDTESFKGIWTPFYSRDSEFVNWLGSENWVRDYVVDYIIFKAPLPQVDQNA